MPAYLEIARGSGIDRVALGVDEQFMIGRHPGSDLVVTDPSASRLHAVIDHFGPSWCLSDVSANGTSVNGAPIRARRISIASGTTIVIGDVSIAFYEYEAPSQTDDETLEPPTPRPALTPGERRVLVALCRPLATDGLVRAPASVGEIAERLRANFQTVKFHLRNLYAKFDIPEAGATRRALLAEAAVRSGAITLVDLGPD